MPKPIINFGHARIKFNVESLSGPYKIWSVLVVGYIITAIGLVGMPGLSRLAIVFVILMIILIAIGNLRNEIRIKRWVLLLVSFYVYTIFLSLLTWAQTYDKSPLYTLGPVTTAWLGAILVAVAIDNGIRWSLVIRALLSAGILQIIAIYFGFDASQDIMDRQGVLSNSSLRLTALAGNPNLLAMTLVLPLFLVYLRPDLISWPWKVASIIFPYYAIIVTGSRKGLALSIVLLNLVLIQEVLSAKRFRIYYVIIIMLMLFVALALFSDINLYYFTHSMGIKSVDRWISVLQGGDTGFETRSYLASLWQEAFFSSPFIGHGLDMFEEISGASMYAHNNYIEISVNGGIVAFILYYSLHIIILRKSMRFTAPKRIFLWGFVLSIAIVEIVMVSYTVKLNTLILILLYYYVQNQEINSSNNNVQKPS